MESLFCLPFRCHNRRSHPLVNPRLGVSVCYHPSCYIPRLCVENTVPLTFLWRSQDIYCVDFVENTLFKSSGDICWSSAFFASVANSRWTKETAMASFLRRLVSRSSDRSFNLIDSSLNTVNCQVAWLGLTSCVLVLLTWHTRGLLQLRYSM